MNTRSGWLGLLAILLSPPFGFLLGITAAVVLWITLADAGLPDWARVLISVMAVTAVPGLWFLILPLWLAVPQVMRIEEPDGHAQWLQEQARAWEANGEALGALTTAPIRSVQALGTTEENAEARLTLLALDLTNGGGCFSAQYILKGERQPMDEPPGDLSATIADEAGTPYVVMTRSLDTSADGGRCSIYFVPAPPPGTTNLRLTVGRLFVFGREASIDGPWTFTVPLRFDPAGVG